MVVQQGSFSKPERPFILVKRKIADAEDFTTFTGHVKFTLLLWHVWGGKRNIVKAIL